MAINPFRIGQLEIPANPQQRPIDFSGLATLGEGLGRYREQQQLGEIMAGAVDPATGELDWNKAAKAIAISGRDPTKVLSQLTAREGLARQEAAQRSTEAYQRAQEEIARARLAEEARANAAREAQSRRQWVAPVPGTLMEPERPGGVIELGPPGQAPTWHPIQRPGAAPAPAPTPGPQSEVPPGVVPGPAPTATLDPERGPPYQVAGPTTAAAPPAPAAAPPAPAAAPPRNEGYLQSLPPAAQIVVKSVADYDRDPASLRAEDKDQILAAAKRYRPDFSPAEFQKRGTPPSSETQGRMGLGKDFLETVPQIKTRIQNDELNSASGRFQAHFGQNRPGELVTQINKGADALVRGLTGAGMSIPEASKYAKAYEFVVYDTKETQLRKVNGLERALRYVVTEQGKGRGGEDFLKGFVSQFGEEVLSEGERAPKKTSKGTSKELPKVQNDEEATLYIKAAQKALREKRKSYEFLVEDLRKRDIKNPELYLRDLQGQ